MDFASTGKVRSCSQSLIFLKPSNQAISLNGWPMRLWTDHLKCCRLDARTFRQTPLSLHLRHPLAFMIRQRNAAIVTMATAMMTATNSPLKIRRRTQPGASRQSRSKLIR